MIVDLNGNPISTEEAKKPEAISLGKESDKLIRSMENRREPYFLVVKRGDKLIVKNTIKLPDGKEKEFLKFIIDKNL